MNNIEGKVVIITGASSGIGEATAKKLGNLGAKIVLAARRKERLEVLKKQIEQNGGTAVYKVTDVADKKQVAELVEYAISKFGRIDVLVNNAGIMPASFLVKNCTDEWDRIIDINIKGILYNIGAVLPHMREQNSGHIINISSNAAYTEISPYSTVYCMTKHAVKNISSGLRQEEAIAGSKIRVTDIGSEMVDTEQIADAVIYSIEQPEHTMVTSVVIQPNL